MRKSSSLIPESSQAKHVGDPSHAASLPAPAPGLEEAAAAHAGSWAPPTAFALARLAAVAAEDPRPLLIAAAPWWLRERGRPFGPGMAQLGVGRDRWWLVATPKEAGVLWAVEEALRSGAVAGVLVALDAPSFVATRRLDMMARGSGALCIALRVKPPDDLSAARVRWRVGPAPSAPHPWDLGAPGAPRWRVRAVKRRDGPPGEWLVEVDDETGRLRVAPGLADHAPVRDAAHAAA